MPRSSSVELAEAASAYNTIASELGLSIARNLNEARRRKLAAMLKRCGGLEGWMAALEKLRNAPFCLGDNDRGWRANLDFLLQPASFTKLIEGYYVSKSGKKNSLDDILEHSQTSTERVMEHLRSKGEIK